MSLRDEIAALRRQATALAERVEQQPTLVDRERVLELCQVLDRELAYTRDQMEKHLLNVSAQVQLIRVALEAGG